jgi:hypothetical protein
MRLAIIIILAILAGAIAGFIKELFPALHDVPTQVIAILTAFVVGIIILLFQRARGTLHDDHWAKDQLKNIIVARKSNANIYRGIGRETIRETSQRLRSGNLIPSGCKKSTLLATTTVFQKKYNATLVALRLKSMTTSSKP